MPAMKNFTRAEVEEYMQYSQTDDDMVRLVDPVEQRICLLAGGLDKNVEKASEDPCYAVWGRCERCDNCTSLRALQNEGIAYKMEIVAGRTYWVISRYLRVDGVAHIMETVIDITDNLLLESDQRDEIGSIINRYNHLLITDSLTNVFNRRFLDESFVPSLSYCFEKGVAVNIAVMDLDGFKDVNDTYGHQAGDRLLQDVAGYWRRLYNSRKNGAERIVVRYGGDEMLVVVCGMPAHEFRSAIERDYLHMRKICYCPNDVQIPFSISFGIASSEELGQGWSWDKLFETADKRLYENKAASKRQA